MYYHKRLHKSPLLNVLQFPPSSFFSDKYLLLSEGLFCLIFKKQAEISEWELWAPINLKRNANNQPPFPMGILLQDHGQDLIDNE